MNRTKLLAPAALAFAMSACGEPPPPPKPPEPKVAEIKKPEAPAKPTVDAAKLAAFQKLPAQVENPANPLTEEKIALGRLLYFDKRISKNHDISCNSCHDLQNFGVDGKAFSEGHRKQLGGRNSPSVYNAAGHLAQFWDGRSPDVEDQAKGPVLNPVEMAVKDSSAAIGTLQSIPGYPEAFAKAFPADKDPVNWDNFGKAVGAFERKLLTPGRWDDFLGGKQDALSDAEKEGLNTFLDTGCAACHSGPYLGGTMYMKSGLTKPWPNDKDLGRFDVTKADADKGMFKVPSLRNVAKTAPYFHDASGKTLRDSIKTMAEYQLGKQLDDAAAAKIETFLGALTGVPPADYIKEPAALPSGPKTPKPDPT